MSACSALNAMRSASVRYGCDGPSPSRYASRSVLNSYSNTSSSGSSSSSVCGMSAGSTISAPRSRIAREGVLEQPVDAVVEAGEIPRDADPRTAEAIGVEERGVVRFDLGLRGRFVPVVRARERREQRRRVGDGSSHRPRRVLGVRDRDDAGAAHEADGGLDPDDPVDRGGADDRAVGLGPDGDGAQVRRDRDAGARARAAGAAVERVWVPALAAAGAPPAARTRRAEVRPLGQVRLAEDHRAGLAEPPDHERVAGGPRVAERERPRRRLHAVGGVDVVLDQHRDPMERSANLARTPLGVHRARRSRARRGSSPGSNATSGRRPRSGRGRSRSGLAT